MTAPTTLPHDDVRAQDSRIPALRLVGPAAGGAAEIIDPAHTRRRLAEALAAAPAGRGQHGNIPL